jgi:hypothetical protein
VEAVAAAADRNAVDRPAAFAVIDALGGLVRLARRSPTLDGSVPLRAAQGCTPLLEGNAFGVQVVLDRALGFKRRLGRWQLVADASAEDVQRRVRGAGPMLAARELVRPGSTWASRLGRGLAVGEGGAIDLWTGLLVRPEAGTWTWLCGAANRRAIGYRVRPKMIPDPGGWVPLVLEIVPEADARTLRLQGEIACLAALRPGLPVHARTLADAPEIGRGHLDFYTQAYFDAKKRGRITRRYRKLVPGEQVAAAPPHGHSAELAVFGPPAPEITRRHACLLPTGPADAVPPTLGRLSQVRFFNAVALHVSWDGHTLAVDPAPESGDPTLAGHARAIAAAWRGVYGDDVLARHRGALLYLTKYVTLHPPGEPHFFVKPWALTRTPPGWSCVIDGEPSVGFDVMRGVVHTDAFFATPSVFSLWRPGPDLDIELGQPLSRITPIPRELLEPSFTIERLDGWELPR